MKNNPPLLGAPIRAFRIRSGLSRQQLAEQLQVSADSITAYELGRRTPSLQVWVRFCEFFHVVPWFRQQDPAKDDLLDISFLTPEQKSLIRQLVSSMDSRV